MLYSTLTIFYTYNTEYIYSSSTQPRIPPELRTHRFAC